MYKKLIFLLTVAAPLFFGQVSVAFAQCSNGATNCIQNPLGQSASICSLLSAILNAAMIIGAPIAILFVVIAGAKFVLARGNPGEVVKARNNLLWVLIGIAIFFGAAVLTKVVFNTINTFITQSGGTANSSLCTI